MLRANSPFMKPIVLFKIYLKVLSVYYFSQESTNQIRCHTNLFTFLRIRIFRILQGGMKKEHLRQITGYLITKLVSEGRTFSD